MHTKGEASEDLRKKLGLDTCIYFGNDLNDITMFSNALDNNEFIVIANNEKQDITDMLVKYLQEECKIKGIEWQDARLLVLEDKNVNSFLHRMSKILGVLNSGKKPKDIRKKYKVDIKEKNRITNQRKRTMDYKRKRKNKQYR